MLITAVEGFHVALPVKLGGEGRSDDAGWSIRDVTSFNHFLLRIETEDGLVGWGEAFAFKGGEALQAIVDTLLKPALLGADTSDIDAIIHRLQFENHLWGRYGLTLFAISAVDIALWDLAGKRAGKPLFEMLGGRRNDLVAYASLPRYGNGDVAAELACRAVSEGYQHIKLHEVEPDIIAQVRGAIGPDISLMVDTNCAWDEADAIAAARSMRDLDLMMIEEPVFPPEDFAALARVREAGGIPIAAGECACTSFEFEHMLQAGAVDFAQPSVSKVGGIGEFIKVSDLCRKYAVSLMPHSPYLGPGFLATAHLLNARHPDSLLECIYPDAIQARFYPDLEQCDGMLAPPQGPGLGLDPDMSVIEQYRVNP
jgi:L-alanine-DL-glutamate epimerase-like enolase superfamily enzyme